MTILHILNNGNGMMFKCSGNLSNNEEVNQNQEKVNQISNQQEDGDNQKNIKQQQQKEQQGEYLISESIGSKSQSQQSIKEPLYRKVLILSFGLAGVITGGAIIGKKSNLKQNRVVKVKPCASANCVNRIVKVKPCASANCVNKTVKVKPCESANCVNKTVKN